MFKSYKITPRNPFIKGFLTLLQISPNFPNLKNYFIEFSMKILFNIQQLLQYKSKHYQLTPIHPYSLRVFQKYQECSRWHNGLIDLNMKKNKTYKTYKTNKKLSLIERFTFVFSQDWHSCPHWWQLILCPQFQSHYI